jgi:pyruvate kinase
VTDHSGDTARLCSKYRPSVPIITVTRNHMTSRYAHLYRGVYPFLYPEPKITDPARWQEDVDARLKWGMKQAIDLGLISVGDSVITVQGWTGGLGHSNTLRVYYFKCALLMIDPSSEFIKYEGFFALKSKF